MHRLLLALSLVSFALAESHLDRLMNRLDGSTPPPSSELVEPATPGPPHRVRHGHQHHDIVQQQEYDEEEDEDDDEEVQADVVPRSPYTSSLRYDWKAMSRNKNLPKYWATYHPVSKSNDEDPKAQTEVRNHLVKMSKEFNCRVPQPKIIKVSDHYPDKSGTYYPSCTKLHVCAEDTGCCGPTQKCGPKATHKVELYFYITVDVVPSLGRGSKTMKIEKLTFYNHTECACQDRQDEMPRDTDSRTGLDNNKIPDQPLQYKCKCPSEYTVRNLANGSCTCDCFDKQRDCTKYKKGKENFNHHDRLCIEMGKCTLPACDFGAFNRRLGRCPRKHEKFRSWARFKL